MSGEPPTPQGSPNAAESLRREEWLQELSEASVLPPEDATRRRIEAQVAERGGWAQSYWLALLSEGESWRRALPEIEPPAELAGRLRMIPAQHPLASVVRRRMAWGAAAAAVLVVGLAWALMGRETGPGFPGQDLRDDAGGHFGDDSGLTVEVAQVALLALNDHLDTHEQDVLSDDPVALARDLQPQIPFPVRLPDLGGVIRPVGGRRCTLGSHPVAFTAWRGAPSDRQAEGGRLTLIQLRRADFGLPADMAPQLVHPQGQAARGSPLDVLFFGRGDTVWVVVADEAQDLQRVRQQVQREYGAREHQAREQQAPAPAQGIRNPAADPKADPGSG